MTVPRFGPGMRRMGPGWRGRHGAHWHDARGFYCGIPPRARLQRRLFRWFGATIFLTVLVVGPIVRVLGSGGSHPPLGLLAALVTASIVLWTASAAIAWRLTRPLEELVRVTQAIGAGNLAARVRLGRHQAGEVGALADSVNEMAGRIERQLREERALLAAVSHELRSPLARLRVLVELARSGESAGRLDEIDREIVEIDALLGKLLASSRLEFGELRREPLTAREVALRALEVAGVPAERLADATDGTLVEVDPTLVGRALGNLLENAERHAGGVTRLALVVANESGRAPVVRFEVLDAGPGFRKDALEHAFEAFYSSRTGETTASEASQRDSRSGSLGLGLALVARIARAHGGRAFAENPSEGGARVVLELPARQGA
ncbi:MAG TPA: HAMP domain-containing sensor histidine kinase [Polyangiaceae bacterium]|nr:HAMP domain-containing sensor histidine kinase [Polyangiaceae bacterium]